MSTISLSRSASILALLGLLHKCCCVDLEPCNLKPHVKGQCGGTAGAVACWSKKAEVPWACWSAEALPDWATHAVSADAACQAKKAAFAGACSFLPPGPRGALPHVPEPLPWDAALSLADELLPQLTPEEKHILLHGIGWKGWQLTHGHYVGGTRAIPRLNISSLNMQDAADGFRLYWQDMLGTATCWPSLLSLAATWDEFAVQDFAVALGKEFSGKGANGILGPSVNVHRVARNGRNFEYISGEDPHLGSKLAAAYVRGVQSTGVFAVMKHFAFNEQETNRNTASSNVDEKTAWELYYPPFQAAVDAGVAATMCSYNKVNGVHACSSKDLLLGVLKQRMGFQGFVQSDWWAAHEMSLPEGLDQEMPGTQNLFSVKALAEQPAERVDDAARRVLSVMYRFDLMRTTKCDPLTCSQFLQANVTGPRHRALARSLATESIVLLKNSESILPISLQSVKTIAIIGSAAVAKPFDSSAKDQGRTQWARGDYYSGGGSGHVVASGVVTPLAGIKRLAESLGINVLMSTTNNPSHAVEVARKADVSIIVAATTSGEDSDRKDLSLDGDADALIAAVADHATKTVVLIQTPGAVLMPWRDSVASILVLFLGGEETGNAWANILFGDYAPAGRLPIMMPESDADTIAPSTSQVVEYSEGLDTSYRNPGFRAAFPFGHGLTYTTFSYGAATAVGNCSAGILQCISVSVRNDGSRPGRTVVQLYLQLPAFSGYKTALLRSFKKTGIILPGTSQHVILHLSAKELSYYDIGTKQWQLPFSAVAHIGESSADIRQTVELEIPGGIRPAFSWLPLLLCCAVAAPLIFYVIIMKRRHDSGTFTSLLRGSRTYDGINELDVELPQR